MRVLVTGGAGFIGSHVVDALVESDHEVVSLDVLHPAAHEGSPDYLHGDVEYRVGDIADAETVRTVARGVDAVCHQAAMVGLGVDFADVGAFVHANDVGTATLLSVLHELRFAGRLVLASSMVVYGEGRYRCATHGIVRPGPRAPAHLAAARWDPSCPACSGLLEPEAVPEDAPIDPRSIYAATKAHQEHLAAAFGREHSVPVTALRYHNVYGPRMPRNSPYAGVASIFRSALESGEAPTVFEDGGQRRDFIHVRDVARANVLALVSDPPVEGALNIASGTPHTVLDLAHALCRAFDGDTAPRVVPRARSGDVRHIFASTTTAKTTLGFSAEVGFDDGISEFTRAPMRSGCLFPRPQRG